MKTCTGCGEEKPLEAFGKRTGVRDGRQARCRACRSAAYRAKPKTEEGRARQREAQRRYRERHPNADRERYYRDVEKTRAQKRASDQRRWDANREELNAKQRAYRARDPERWREYRRQYREANYERTTAATEAWRQANLPRVRERDLAWRRANPEKVRDYAHRYRCETADPSEDTANYISVLFHDPCCYCGGPSHAIDHIDGRNPKTSKGRHEWMNLTRACKRCNGSKGDKPLLLWLATRSTDLPTTCRE